MIRKYKFTKGQILIDTNRAPQSKSDNSDNSSCVLIITSPSTPVLEEKSKSQKVNKDESK